MELASDSVCSSVTSEKEEESSVPQSLHWTTEQVAEWIEGLGFKQYRVGCAVYLLQFSVFYSKLLYPARSSMVAYVYPSFA